VAAEYVCAGAPEQADQFRQRSDQPWRVAAESDARETTVARLLKEVLAKAVFGKRDKGRLVARRKTPGQSQHLSLWAAEEP
jgi:hypothetical protein